MLRTAMDVALGVARWMRRRPARRLSLKDRVGWVVTSAVIVAAVVYGTLDVIQLFM